MELTRGFKLLLLGLVVFVTTFVLAVYINLYVYRSRAQSTPVPPADSALVTPPSQSTSTIRAHFSPASAKMAVGDQISTNLVIDGFATGQQVSAFDVTMQVADGIDIVGFSMGTTPPVPPATATPRAATPPAAIVTPGPAINPAQLDLATSNEYQPGCTTIVKKWDSTTRIARISQLCIGATLLDSVLVPIMLKGTKNATGKITVSDLEVVGPASSSGYSVAKEAFSFQVGSGSGDGRTGGGTSGNMQLILTLRLQGIQAKPPQTNALPFKVGVVNSSMESPVYQNASFTPDETGLYHGNVGLNAPTGSGFCILVKGPYHLQKKICDSAPTETFPGTYTGEKGKITLTAGDNTFDFSKIYMMSCDLPAQDGICNSYDMALLRENLGKSDSNASTDINQDGITNGQDYALAIASLSIKVDDK